MKDVKRYCNECKKETNKYMKVQILNKDHKVETVRSFDLCERCIRKRFPEFDNPKRAGLQQ